MNLYITKELDVTDVESLNHDLVTKHPLVAAGRVSKESAPYSLYRYGSHDRVALVAFLEQVYEMDELSIVETIVTLKTIDSKFVVTATFTCDTYEEALELSTAVRGSIYSTVLTDVRIDEKHI